MSNEDPLHGDNPAESQLAPPTPAGASSPDEQPVAQPDSAGSEQKWILSPRVVAVMAGIAAIGCLATLAIVTAVEGDEALSTIALALAILAFVVQILIFTAQAQSSSLQMLRSEQLNTQTRALLAEMQTTARTTETMVREQFGQVLRAFMDAVKASEDPKGGRFDPEAFEERLLRNIRRDVMAAAPERPPQTARRAVARPSGATVRERARDESSGPFPTEDEAHAALTTLRALSPAARARLRDFARDAARSARTGSWVGIAPDSLTEGVDKELADHGLIRIARFAGGEGPSTGEAYQLTPQGEPAASFMNSRGQVPQWAEDVFEPAPEPADRA